MVGILSISITYIMTLLFLIAFVYLLFAYQNYLNKKEQENESNGSEVTSDLQSRETTVTTEEIAESMKPIVSIESVLESQSVETLSENKELGSLSDFSSSNPEISPVGTEDMAIKNSAEDECIYEEENTSSSFPEVPPNQSQSEEALNYPKSQEESQEESQETEKADISFEAEVEVQEEKGSISNELLEDESKKES